MTVNSPQKQYCYFSNHVPKNLHAHPYFQQQTLKADQRHIWIVSSMMASLEMICKPTIRLNVTGVSIAFINSFHPTVTTPVTWLTIIMLGFFRSNLIHHNILVTNWLCGLNVTCNIHSPEWSISVFSLPTR